MNADRAEQIAKAWAEACAEYQRVKDQWDALTERKNELDARRQKVYMEWQNWQADALNSKLPERTTA